MRTRSSAPAAVPARSTGVARLDELLEGGLPLGSATLLHGPPFLGKEVLARLFLLHGMRQGRPGVLVLTGMSASEARAQLARIDERYPEHEDHGLVHFLDLYSKPVGRPLDAPHTEYLDNQGYLLAAAKAVARQAGERGGFNLVVDSVSTLVAYGEPRAVFRDVHLLVGRARAAGGTTVLLLDRGMHPEAETLMFKHLTTGCIEMRTQNAKALLHVEGNLSTEDKGWVEYRHTLTSFDITGSFSAGRIR